MSYHGEMHVKRIGDYVATLEMGDFDRLAYATDALHFEQFRDEYTSNVTCLPSVTTTVFRGDKSKSVYVYGRGPAEVWLLDEAIDHVVERAEEWKRVRLKKTSSDDLMTLSR